MTTISSIPDLIEQISIAQKGPHFSKEQTHVRIWFRGQPGPNLPLKPRVYRDKMATMNEGGRLRTERDLMQDFRLQSGGLRDSRATEQEVYLLQQHYRMPTRLLDWTTSPLAGLFFAVADTPDKKHEKDDGELFMMDASRFQSAKNGSQPRKYKLSNEKDARNFLGIADAGHPILRESVRIIAWYRGDHNSFPEFIIPLRPHYFDVRVGLQRSCFTFHVPNQPEINPDINPSLTRFRIPEADKPSIRQQLSTLGIDPFRIFGDLEHLSDTLVNAYGALLNFVWARRGAG